MSAYYQLEVNAINFLNKKLNLPSTGVEQDWEVELADPSRINEFLELYESQTLTEPQSRALMALIIASLDSLVESSITYSGDFFYRARFHLIKSRELFIDIIKYWALTDNLSEKSDTFAITNFMREIYKQEISL